MAAEATVRDSDALVFVYGTLRRGQRNHGQMQGCRWLGEAELPGLALYDLGPFPMAVPCDDVAADPDAVAGATATPALQGELYGVSAQQLAALDRFEGVPRLYERQARRLADGRLVWVYVGRAHQVRHVKRIPSGRWLAALMALAPAIAQGADSLRHDCLLWQQAHGLERAVIADRIGQAQLLTRARQPGQVAPGGHDSLYSPNDIQRLCRRQ